MTAGKTGDVLPDGLLLSWFGDDFTGSAAAMEVLGFGGVRSVLFLKVPTPEQLALFDGVRAIGIASTARSRSPGWLEENLPGPISFLSGLGAPLLHYKICSTLDSSPEIGSIGKAIDIIRQRDRSPWIPLFTAAPPLGRYQAFGNLYARYGDQIYRLDRHPVMARHPVTPMRESDVGRHIAQQTERTIGLVNLLALNGAEGAAEEIADKALRSAVDGGAEIVSLDACDDTHLEAVGRLIWSNRGEGALAVGSQGVEYALLEYWRAAGMLEAPSPPAGRGEVDQIAVVSGSVSQVTSGQIDWALDNGFAGIAFDVRAMAGGDRDREAAIAAAAEAALASLSEGRDPIVYAAKGPDDRMFFDARAAFEASGMGVEKGGRLIGEALGRVLSDVARRADLKRLVISGGDTSGHAAGKLGIFAVTPAAPTVPGAALLDARSDDPALENLEIALKGGQMGTPDYFGWIKQGGGEREDRNGQ